MPDQNGGGDAPKQSFQPDEVFVAPPLADDDIDLPEPPKWPKVVGIISIVWGGLGLCCGVLGGGGLAAQPMLMKVAQDQGQFSDGLPPQLLSPQPALLGIAVFGVLWAVFLIIAGATTASRRPAGRMMHLVYGAGALVLVVISTALQLSYYAKIGEWVNANPTTQYAQQAQASGLFQYLGLVVGIVLGLAWPLFCLVWFGLVKKRPEDMTGGAVEPAA